MPVRRRYATALRAAFAATGVFAGVTASAQARDERSPAEQAIVRLAPSHRHVVIADVLRHSLDVWRNDDGNLHHELSVPMVLGTGGVGKLAEGDRRTPLGAYRVVGLRDGASLPPEYGPRAWVLDYPNAWDQQLGRTGSGIWLHGSGGERRLRKSSTGCIVLRPRDLGAVERLVGSERPWVLIVAARSDRQAGDADVRQARRLLAAWQRARLAAKPGDLSKLYASTTAATSASSGPQPVSVDNISAFALPGRWVLEFSASDGASEQRRVQHWKVAQGQWKIAAEGAIE